MDGQFCLVKKWDEHEIFYVASSISLLVENKPDVILAFGKEQKLDLEGWKAVLRCLQDQVRKQI